MDAPLVVAKGRLEANARDMDSDATVTPVDAATLPPFSNHRAVCARWEIRVHFDRGCNRVQGGDHFHRLCSRCGYEWIERCKQEAR